MAKPKYIFELVKEEDFNAWLNERANEGYKMEKAWMVTRRELQFATVMRLTRLGGDQG